MARIPKRRNRVSFGEWFGIGIILLGTVLALVCSVIAFVSGGWGWGIAFSVIYLGGIAVAASCAWESLYG
jgi:hypothetical protein